MPVLVSVTCAWKPLAQELTTEYTPEHRCRGRRRAVPRPPFAAPGSANWMAASSDCFGALTGVGS